MVCGDIGIAGTVAILEPGGESALKFPEQDTPPFRHMGMA
jgi:hypothetical protein